MLCGMLCRTDYGAMQVVQFSTFIANRRVHSRTFSAVNETALKDVKLFEKINSLKFVTMQHLDIPAPFHQPQLLESAKEEVLTFT